MLSYRGAVRVYAGLYTVKQIDVHPIVGKTPISGSYIANGFSGHGFKLAEAIGSLIVQEITGEGLSSFGSGVNPALLAFDRAPIAVAAKNELT